MKMSQRQPIEGEIFEDTGFTRNIFKYMFKKIFALKFPEFLIWKMLLAFLQKILSMLP